MAGDFSFKGTSGGFGVVFGFVLFATVALLSQGAWGQQIPACASKLYNCSSYLNATTKPPDDCCRPLREVITSDLNCLCNLYSNQDLLKNFGINVTQVLALPQLCGITGAGVGACNAPSPTAGAPPGTSGSNCGLAWIGMSGLAGLLLLWASMMV